MCLHFCNRRIGLYLAQRPRLAPPLAAALVTKQRSREAFLVIASFTQVSAHISKTCYALPPMHSPPIAAKFISLSPHHSSGMQEPHSRYFVAGIQDTVP
ncbi:hypothetical protein OBBRIDRAFT_790682 [Obba rivulosa]|uniref:Uncharacterized protein n=1 Tax=Obba rivulosa TaxID=1052685 RepID=A0A8E2DNG9_9APHY|nr:hypothetical protein OBBRIDRAFT_790682 [Obba rivulosa]